MNKIVLHAATMPSATIAATCRIRGLGGLLNEHARVVLCHCAQPKPTALYFISVYYELIYMCIDTHTHTYIYTRKYLHFFSYCFAIKRIQGHYVALLCIVVFVIVAVSIIICLPFINLPRARILASRDLLSTADVAMLASNSNNTATTLWQAIILLLCMPLLFFVDFLLLRVACLVFGDIRHSKA